ncbi:MAG: hypothetical protein JSS81_02380 [Acidobacteria bacterium]|nr:hypothetical protein [Acidobacteriota bacterium]
MSESDNHKKSGFRLEKWYLDLVTDDGTAMIFYYAVLNWGLVTVPYAARMRYGPEGQLEEEWHFYPGVLPAAAGDDLFYRDRLSKAEGSWAPGAAPVGERLFENGGGTLEWNCHRPNSRVTLKTGGGLIEGRGYAEQLVMTVRPWDIPMTRLRWGRFAGARDSVVWIEMTGEPHRQWVWLNGRAISAAAITDEGVSISGGETELRFSEPKTLGEEKKIGSVVKKVAGYIPGIDSLMPSRFLLAEQTRWRSRGALLVNGEVVDTGWVIHERVDFDG